MSAQTSWVGGKADAAAPLIRGIAVVTSLTSDPAAAQLMRLLLGLAIQKVEVALKEKERDTD